MGAIKRDSPVTLLSAVVATGAGSATLAYGFSRATVAVTVTSETTGGVLQIEGSVDGTSFGILTPTGSVVSGCAISNGLITLSADGTYIVKFEGLALKEIRANLSARTDGTYTVKVSMAE